MSIPEHRGPAWPIVMRRELTAKLTDKGFLIGTLVSLVILVGYFGYVTFTATKSQSYAVGVTAADRATAATLVTRAKGIDATTTITLTEVPDAAGAKAGLDDERLDAWLHQQPSGWTLTSRDGSDALATILGQAISAEVLADQATRLGTSPEELLKSTRLTQAYLIGDAEKAGLAKGVGFAFAFLFYLAALMYGITIAQSVVEEKQSRIVEIIAAAIPIRHLLAGKILGNSILALGQVLLYAVVGLVGMSLAGYGKYLGVISGPMAWFVAFFIVGFVALASLWAVAGSLASRTEDVQATSGPLTILVMLVLFSGLFATGTVREVLSFVPPTSIVAMPMRVVEGAVPISQVLLSLGLLVAFAAVTITVGERLYRRSLLKTQGRVSLRAAWSSTD